MAKGDSETARAKNQALKDAGARVPENFFEFGNLIKEVYDGLVEAGTLVPAAEVEEPKVPMGKFKVCTNSIILETFLSHSSFFCF